jgi:hypothetical protein
MSRKRHWKPYLMRGAPVPSEARPTSVDQADARVPEVRPRKLNAEEIRIVNRVIATDPRLRAVDRCFERWARTPTESRGPAIAAVVFVSSVQSGAVPLDDAESKIVDTAVRTSPKWARNFVHMWYRQGLTIAEIAKLLQMKRYEHVHEERHLVLGYYLGRLSESSVQLRLGS